MQDGNWSEKRKRRHDPDMDVLHPPLRRATQTDAPAMAELINFAGEGLPEYFWAKVADPGESVWDVGRRRATRDEGGFSYRNTIVLDIDGAVAACLIGYPLPGETQPIDASAPPMFVPLEELEALASGRWYINIQATYPGSRGYGSRLLAAAL